MLLDRSSFAAIVLTAGLWTTLPQKKDQPPLDLRHFQPAGK